MDPSGMRVSGLICLTWPISRIHSIEGATSARSPPLNTATQRWTRPRHIIILARRGLKNQNCVKRLWVGVIHVTTHGSNSYHCLKNKNRKVLRIFLCRMKLMWCNWTLNPRLKKRQGNKLSMKSNCPMNNHPSDIKCPDRSCLNL